MDSLTIYQLPFSICIERLHATPIISKEKNISLKLKSYTMVTSAYKIISVFLYIRHGNLHAKSSFCPNQWFH